MRPQRRFMVNTHSEFVHEFLCNKMVLSVSSFWFAFTALVLALFRILTRFLIDDDSQKKISGSRDALPLEEDDQGLEDLPELEVVDHGEEEESPKFTFKFHFPRYEDTSSSGDGDLTASTSSSGNGDLKASTSKYEFSPNHYFSGFMEEPVGSFVVKEMFSSPIQDRIDDREILDDGFLSEKFFLENKVDDCEEMVNNSGEGEEKRESVVLNEAPLSEMNDSGEGSEKHESVVLNEAPLSEMNNSGEGSGKNESAVLNEAPLLEKKKSVDDLDRRAPTLEKEEFDDEARFLSENELVSSDSEPELINLWDKFSVMVDRMDSSSDGFSSDGEFDGAAKPESVAEVVDDRKAEPIGAFSFGMEEGDAEITSPTTDLDEMVGGIEKLEELNLPNSDTRTTDANVENELQKIQAECDQEELNLPTSSNPESDVEVERELQKIQAECDREELDLPNSSTKGTDAQVERELQKIQAECEQVFHFPNSSTPEADDQIECELQKIQAECEEEDSTRERNKIEDNSGMPEESSLQSWSSEDYEDSSNLETLWEHQDLIEQLKMEIRKVRATGLPTIFEESESPRMSEDLKPWKIDEKVVHADQIDGLHKFYNRYNERMRKFDILNYQKMYAIGFLKLKDPLRSISTQKSSTNLTSLLSQNILLPKRRKSEEDASVTFLKELESDLEQVYVGQLCLSWEFLHWQYGKARELLESDPYEVRPYNHVAGEFQQFQVLLQRFVENEPFQGLPRVQSYIKNRCVLRNLLQVPLIREDPVDKEGRKRSKDAITCSLLLDIIEESMRVFWEFVRADKHETHVILKGLKPNVKFTDPEDANLFMEIQTDLQKKEKKVKDILRSGNCLVKKFQKQPKEQPDELLLFSQIDLKLVSRVLRMSRLTTAELTWCQKKLSRISFVQRKIHVENSFLLFPC